MLTGRRWTILAMAETQGEEDRSLGTLCHTTQRVTSKMRDPGHRQQQISSRPVLAVRRTEHGKDSKSLDRTRRLRSQGWPMYRNHYGNLDCRQGVVGQYRQEPYCPVNTGDRQAETEPDGQKLRETSKTRDPGHRQLRISSRLAPAVRRIEHRRDCASQDRTIRRKSRGRPVDRNHAVSMQETAWETGRRGAKLAWSHTHHTTGISGDG